MTTLLGSFISPTITVSLLHAQRLVSADLTFKLDSHVSRFSFLSLYRGFSLPSSSLYSCQHANCKTVLEFGMPWLNRNFQTGPEGGV